MDIMVYFRKYNSILWLIILLFILLCLAILNRPYFWDEAWSYMPAIHEMANHSPCLYPGCISPELYRGHPLLFYFVSSGWMKWINPSPISMHLLALLIASLALVSLFKLSLLFLDSLYAVLSVPLLILQEVFLAQASFVLPEVLLMFLLTQALRYFVLKKYFHFFIYGSLMGLTKETGLVLLLPFLFITIFTKTQPFSKSLPVYASALPAILFYIVQKLNLGWFFYPLHIDMIDFSLGAFLSKLSIILKFTFFEQGRIFLLLTLLLALQYPLLKRGLKKHLIFIAVGLLVMILVFVLHKLAFTLLVLTFIGICLRIQISLRKSERDFIYIGVMIVFIVLIFSALNFLMTRYLIIAFPTLIVLWIMAMAKALDPYRRNFIAILSFVFLVLLFSIFHNFTRKGWHDDASINFINAVRSHQAAIKFCDQHNWSDKNIFTHFLMQQNLTQPALGYLSGPAAYKHTVYGGEIPRDTELIIFSCIELDEYRYESVRNNPNFKLIYRNQLHQAWTEIYSTDLKVKPMIIDL